MLNIGMVGCGNISPIYLKNLTEVFRDVRLLGVCDLVRERAENARKTWNVPKLYETAEELIADPEIDVVLNLTRPYQHYGVSKAALLGGKHVYSEKPLAADLDEGRELVALAEEKGLWLGGAPDTFMGAAIQTCRQLIDGGVIGTPLGGHFAMLGHGMETWHTDPDFFYQRGGGPLFDMGPYYITAMINLLGGLKRVFGTAHRSYDERLITAEPHRGEIIHVTVPTHIDSILTFDSGISVSMTTSFDVWSTRRTNIEIYGTKGTLYVPDPNGFTGRILFADANGEREYPVVFDYTENSRALGLCDMAAAIEQGRSGRTTYRQTFHVLEAMCGILESAKTGVPHEMESKFERQAPMDVTKPHGYL